MSCARGAAAAGSAAEVAACSDIVITMLPDSPDVETVVVGPEGVLEGIQEGPLYIDMSTIAPAVSRRIADAMSERGVAAVDAPVSGGASGPRRNAIDHVRRERDGRGSRASDLRRAGQDDHPHRPPGAGQVAKAANQIVVALTIHAVAEALTLAGQGGSGRGTRPRGAARRFRA